MKYATRIGRSCDNCKFNNAYTRGKGGIPTAACLLDVPCKQPPHPIKREKKP